MRAGGKTGDQNISRLRRSLIYADRPLKSFRAKRSASLRVNGASGIFACGHARSSRAKRFACARSCSSFRKRPLKRTCCAVRSMLTLLSAEQSSEKGEEQCDPVVDRARALRGGGCHSGGLSPRARGGECKGNDKHKPSWPEVGGGHGATEFWGGVGAQNVA
jgi:hypothetical protein